MQLHLIKSKKEEKIISDCGKVIVPAKWMLESPRKISNDLKFSTRQIKEMGFLEYFYFSRLSNLYWSKTEKYKSKFPLSWYQ